MLEISSFLGPKNCQVGDFATMPYMTLASDFCQSLIASEIPFHVVQEESDYII